MKSNATIYYIAVCEEELEDLITLFLKHGLVSITADFKIWSMPWKGAPNTNWEETLGDVQISVNDMITKLLSNAPKTVKFKTLLSEQASSIQIKLWDE